jgi:hypothetical protein
VAAQTGSRSGAQPLSSLHAAVRPRSHGGGGGGDAAAPCQTASDAPAGTQRLKDVRHTAATNLHLPQRQVGAQVYVWWEHPGCSLHTVLVSCPKDSPPRVRYHEAQLVACVA